MKIHEIMISQYTIPEKPSSDGRYHVNVCTNEGKRKQICGRTKEEIKQKLIAFCKSEDGTGPKPFSVVYQACVKQELLRAEKNGKLGRQSTVNRRQCEYNRYIKDTEFEKCNIDEIDDRMIINFINGVLASNEVLPRSLGTLRTILNKTFQYAYNQHWTDEMPVSRVDWTQFKNDLKEATPITERAHSEDELRAILQEIHEKEKKKPFFSTYWALEFQLLTGCRRGEIPPLLLSDIRKNSIFFHREQIDHRTKGEPIHYTIVNHTKTHHNRNFPLYEGLKEFLEVYLPIRAQYWPDSEFLFPADTENGCIDNLTVGKCYTRICEKLGIALSRDCVKGTHSFRRNGITHMLNETGGDIRLTAKMYGNSPRAIEASYDLGGINTKDMASAEAALNAVGLFLDN